jgi:antitoxin component HigA of HigAB toxin-antitoxin module
VLSLLIEDYEKRITLCPSVAERFPKRTYVRTWTEAQGHWPVLGNKGAATEVLSRRRSISKTQAKRLAEFFRVPIDIFV